MTLDRLLATEGSANELESFLRICNETSDALAANRATKSLPIIVAQSFFVSAIAVAFAKMIDSNSKVNYYLNIESNSIAYSALYFWILPAVFLSSVIGTSQTKNAVPRILRQFRAALEDRLHDIEIVLPNYIFDKEHKRIIHGGICSWQPDRGDEYKSKQPWPLFQRNALPLLIVAAGTGTSILVSAYVPPNGWQPRHCARASMLMLWLLSYSLTCLLKRYTSSPSYNDKGRFWLTFSKDAISTSANIGCTIITQWGIWNNCASYTRWGRTGLQLPGMPDVAATLNYRVRVTYPAIIFVSIVLHMVVVPLVIVWWYRHALLVFLQRDEESSSPLWFLRWNWSCRNARKPPKCRRPEKSVSDAEAFVVMESKGGTRLEKKKLWLWNREIVQLCSGSENR